MNRIVTSLSLFIFLTVLPQTGRADLDAYFKKSEPSYRWDKRGEQNMDGCKVYDLHLVSQVWQGIPWEHRLQVFVPDNAEFPHFCTILNTGGSGSSASTQAGALIARQSGAMYAVLYNIPNQPLFGGKVEDELVVHTWLKFLETGDESWPLHFPMAKAVLKAMDALQAFAKESGLPKVNGFLIHGGSKRGWTTYLAAASRDRRIKAIAPMVIDVLNVIEQSKHMMASYGKPSEEIDDYTKAGIQEKLMTPQGQRLMELEDPYSYRDRFTMPKLLVLGTNDRYWTQDALNLYWDGLKHPKWVLYTPNSGHGLEDRDRVYATLISFIRMVAGKGKWPRMHWSYTDDARGGATLAMESDTYPTGFRLFHAESKTKDFRDSRWSYEEIKPSIRGFQAHWPAPESGYTAIFGEAVYTIDGRTFTLSTQIRILEHVK